MIAYKLESSECVLIRMTYNQMLDAFDDVFNFISLYLWANQLFISVFYFIAQTI